MPCPLPQSHFFVKFLAASTPVTQNSLSPREVHLGFLGQSCTFLGLARNRFKKWAGLGIYYSSGQRNIKENSAERASGKFSKSKMLWTRDVVLCKDIVHELWSPSCKHKGRSSVEQLACWGWQRGKAAKTWFLEVNVELLSYPPLELCHFWASNYVRFKKKKRSSNVFKLGGLYLKQKVHHFRKAIKTADEKTQQKQRCFEVRLSLRREDSKHIWKWVSGIIWHLFIDSFNKYLLHPTMYQALS